MSILTGIKKQKEYITNQNGDHTLVSRWTSAETVEMPNGDTLDQYSFADEKVKQTIDNSSLQSLPVLFSGSASATTTTEGAKKTTRFSYKPSSGIVTLLDGEENIIEICPYDLVMRDSRAVNYVEAKISSNSAQLSVGGNVEGEIDTKAVFIHPSDIILFRDTWDGTHSSLKDAITAGGSGGGGLVDDVTVNGVSVVTNRVAAIKSYKVVTQAEYDALVTPETGVMYCISDAPSGDIGTLNDLSDVVITTPVNGQTLVYDSANSRWINGSSAGGASDLEDLTDVVVTTPTNGQALTYDSTTSKWVNTTLSSELPSVTSSDNNKILKVVSGTWAAATDTAADTVKQSVGTANEYYRVLLSGTADSTEHVETTKKSGDLTFNPAIHGMILSTHHSASMNGCSFDLKYINTDGNTNWVGMTASETVNHLYITTTNLVYPEITLTRRESIGSTYVTRDSLELSTTDITLDGTNNTWDGTHASLKDAIAAAGGGSALPSVTSSDNGKVLKVVSGAWAKGEDSDTNVLQAPTTTSGEYEVLFSGTANDTATIEGVRKTARLVYNPSDGKLGLHNTTTNYIEVGIPLTTDSDSTVAYLKPDQLELKSGQNIGSIDLKLKSGNVEPHLEIIDSTSKDITIKGTDIVLGGTDNTWDGTHTSLKDALASGGGGGGFTDITGTLTAGNTTVTLTDPAIVTTATFDFYTDTYGVNPTDINVITGSITLTFEEQASDVIVKVRVS